MLVKLEIEQLIVKAMSIGLLEHWLNSEFKYLNVYTVIYIVKSKCSIAKALGLVC